MKRGMTMTKIDLVREEMMKALKARDAKRKDALSLLLSALKAKYIDKRADLTEEEENAIVYKEIKEAQETMDTAPADRVNIIEECKLRISVYSEFAPQRMGEEEIKQIIQKAMEQLGIVKPAPQEKGRIMRSVMPLVKGKADGGMVNRLVEESLR
jgi:uncharacterized protein YqeY